MKILDKNDRCSYFPAGANVFSVGIDNPFMREAKEMAKLSNERQQPVGAVLVCDGKIIEKTHNRSPLVNSFFVNLHKKFCVRHFLGVPTGVHYWMCPGCASKKSHAEYQASKSFLRKNIDKKPVDVYMWGHWACCDVCSKAMSEVPIDNFYVLEGCEVLFDPKKPGNIIGHQFDKD